MLIKLPSILTSGLETISVDIEINLANRGLPGFEIVGLPSKAVDESKERVKTAILNSGINFPSKKIIVNLAPADMPKEGSFYDLPIAIGIISAIVNCVIPEKTLFFGELSLDGSVRSTKGVFLLALYAKEHGFKNIFIPKASMNEALVFEGINIYPVDHLSQVLMHLLQKEEIMSLIGGEYKEDLFISVPEFDMKEVLGQEQAKRAIEISAAGGHNILMIGSPGSGKTMLARAIPGILPILNDEESLEVTKIYSATGNIPQGKSMIKIRPFRSPHHSASQVGLIGGGGKPQPGEITLAHRGVLFLDEFNEFPRSVLEALRQPMEDGNVIISRSKERVNYPTKFMLVASANPCPCGYLNHPQKACACTEREIKRYRKKVSGPILDRIDIHINVPSVDIKKFTNNQNISQFLESSEIIRERIFNTRKIQEQRFKKENIQTNAEMRNNLIKKYCPLKNEVEKILTQASLSFHLSARSYFKMIKIARTIADLENSENIKINHMAEALQYRSKTYDTE